jgi:hypothetical protein
MANEPYPYNLPPWRRSHRASSPDGRFTAEIREASEMCMSGPTKGKLGGSGVREISDCSPAFLWSEDSRYLAVPQWVSWFLRRPKQRMIIYDMDSSAVYASEPIFTMLILERFSASQLSGTDSPLLKPKAVTISLERELKRYRKI